MMINFIIFPLKVKVLVPLLLLRLLLLSRFSRVRLCATPVDCSLFVSNSLRPH